MSRLSLLLRSLATLALFVGLASPGLATAVQKRQASGSQAGSREPGAKQQPQRSGKNPATANQGARKAGGQNGKTRVGRRAAQASLDAQATRLALRRAKEEAHQEQIERALKLQEGRDKRLSVIVERLATQRAEWLEHDQARRELTRERSARLTENQAYHLVSRRKSRYIRPPKHTFSPGPRQGVTRGKKRGSAYLNKLIQRSSRSGGGRGRGRGRNNGSQGRF